MMQNGMIDSHSQDSLQYISLFSFKTESLLPHVLKRHLFTYLA